MSTAGCAEALLAQQRDPEWAGFDLLDPVQFMLAEHFLTRMLEEYEDMLKKEPGWIEREHTPVYVRTDAPNPYPVPYWGAYGQIMQQPG